MAFGLAVVAMAYTISVLLDCHINPSITLGAWLCGRIKSKDALLYMIFQVIGAVIVSTLLYVLVAILVLHLKEL